MISNSFGGFGSYQGMPTYGSFGATVHSAPERRAIAMSGYERHYGAGEGAFATGIAAKASKQVARAIAGSKLSDYRSAEDLSTFWYAPTSVGTAYLKAAYWLAVASRLGGSGLASSASAALAKGNASLYNPLGWAASSLLSPESVLQEAGETIAAVGGGNAQLKAIAKILGVQSTQVVAAKQRAWEQSPAGVAIDTAKLTFDQFRGHAKRPWYFWPAVIGIPLAMLLLFSKITGLGGRARSAAADVQRRATAAYSAATT